MIWLLLTPLALIVGLVLFGFWHDCKTMDT
jgi:uncharacterized protein YneF (UPF0154 family)